MLGVGLVRAGQSKPLRPSVHPCGQMKPALVVRSRNANVISVPNLGLDRPWHQIEKDVDCLGFAELNCPVVGGREPFSTRLGARRLSQAHQACHVLMLGCLSSTWKFNRCFMQGAVVVGETRMTSSIYFSWDTCLGLPEDIVCHILVRDADKRRTPSVQLNL